MGWKEEGKGFLESDVVKWTEAIWAPSRMRKQRKPWGKQEVRKTLTVVPRSAYLLEGAVRWEWEHSIPPVNELR